MGGRSLFLVHAALDRGQEREEVLCPRAQPAKDTCCFPWMSSAQMVQEFDMIAELLLRRIELTLQPREFFGPGLAVDTGFIELDTRAASRLLTGTLGRRVNRNRSLAPWQ